MAGFADALGPVFICLDVLIGSKKWVLESGIRRPHLIAQMIALGVSEGVGQLRSGSDVFG